MYKAKYIFETTFKGKQIKLIFDRKNGTNFLRNFSVRSENEEHKFSIEYDGNKFEVKGVKSADTTNGFHTEMEKAIELIKDKLI